MTVDTKNDISNTTKYLSNEFSGSLENGNQCKFVNGEKDKTHSEKEKWGNKAEFLLSCIGLSVGIGNVWRFPYLAYQNGGGAFLVAYAIILLLVAKPLYFAELAIGQFTSSNALQVWRCFPLAKGVGIAMIVMSTLIGIYYNVIMAYTLYYIGQSCRSIVPWKECYAWWGADSNCYVRTSNQIHDNFSIDTKKQTASEQFWERHVLELTSGLDNIGTVKWDLALTLFACWIIVFLGLSKGIKSSGKVVYFTATFPYVILITMVIYGCTLPGAIEGLKYFFVPDWSKLLEIKVWHAAAEQSLFSLSIGAGCLIMYSSFNDFKNTIYRDAMFVSILDFATSIVSGVVIFAVLGNMATEMNLDISTVAKGGQGLAFVTYPEALARLPVSQLWSILFFFMLFLLAIDSEFSYLENVFLVIFDLFPILKRRKPIAIFVLCMLFFLLGLPCVTQGGQYVLNLMDRYGGGYAGLHIAIFEILALMWGYGAERFTDDMEFMLGFRMGLYWRICWKYVSPIILTFIVIYGWVYYEHPSYGNVPYPSYADIIGVLFMLLSLIQIPLWAIIQCYKYRKNLRQVLKPHPLWGPHDPEILREYRQKFHIEDESQWEINYGMDLVKEEFKENNSVNLAKEEKIPYNNGYVNATNNLNQCDKQNGKTH